MSRDAKIQEHVTSHFLGLMSVLDRQRAAVFSQMPNYRAGSGSRDYENTNFDAYIKSPKNGSGLFSPPQCIHNAVGKSPELAIVRAIREFTIRGEVSADDFTEGLTGFLQRCDLSLYAVVPSGARVKIPAGLIEFSEEALQRASDVDNR
jgi:hypothetical protein